uniref:Lipocalin n=1 Tax=Rhipicephalus appendiculatus TaxID=34631 RepID=A0A131YTT7_RHIAP
MRLFAIGVLALHAFLSYRTFTVTAFLMPGNSTSEIVLVGYSADLKIKDFECIKSTYITMEKEWMKRYLHFTFIGAQRSRTLMQLAFYTKVEKYPLDVEVRNKGTIVDYFGAKKKYQIRYYDETSLVLSDPIRKVWELEPCSFWVTKKSINKISQLANETFFSICKNATFVGFKHPCF